MKQIVIICVALLTCALCGAYYYFIWPPMALQHKAEHALGTFNAAVATHDRAKIGEALNTLLAPTAHVKIAVSFAAPGSQNTPAVVQEFDREQFTAFVDNVLYALKTYSFVAKLTGFRLSPSKETAHVVFDSPSEADDLLYYTALQAGVHFHADITCSGQAAFPSGNAILDNADCTVKLTLSAQQVQAK